MLGKARRIGIFAAIFFACFLPSTHAQSDPLPSWNNTSPKQTITNFVQRVTHIGSPDFVPPDQRIATFDNDGTLWVEQPMYFQLAFVIDRVKQLAPQHPEWKTTQPFKRRPRGRRQGRRRHAAQGPCRTLGGHPRRHDHRRV